ncbi:MAG TPA: hypothetical protein VMS77_02420 [Conexivisphaerales archaeon]|nr:hypothetical protein [Conexivisphaerales archaeon]
MPSAGVLKAFRWVELGSVAAVMIVIGLVMLSGFGTLLAASLSQPQVAVQGKVVSVSLGYHAINPGPLSTDDVFVWAKLYDADGNLLVASQPQSFRVAAFGSARGNMTFSLDFSTVPQAIYDSFRSGKSAVRLIVGLESGVSGLVSVEVDSNLTLAGVG